MNKSGKRQIRGEGLLREKNGKWEGDYTVYKEDGSAITKSFTRPTITEINDIKAELRVLGIVPNEVIDIKIDRRTDKITLVKTPPQNSSGKIKLNKDTTVNDYVDYWLWNYRRKGQKGKRIKDSTMEDYVEKSKYIKKKMGTVILNDGKVHELKVRDLTFEFMEEKMLELFDETCKYTAIQIRNHLYNLVKHAKKDKLIDENPFEDEEINFPDTKEPKERQIIKDNDIAKVMKYCLELWYIDVLTQLLTGSRVSEVRGLRWVDINEEEYQIKFSNNYITAKQYKIDENGHIVSEGRKSKYTTLKSKSSERIIEAPKELMEILKIHKTLQINLAQRLNIEFKETDPVFTTSTYNQIGRNFTNARVKKVVKELNINNWQEISSHCLRHSFCYAGIFNDVPINYMSKLMRS